MKRKNTFYRRLAFGAAAVIGVALFVAAGRIAGNPLIKFYLEKKTEDYLHTEYPQHSLEITKAVYSGADMFSFCFTVQDASVRDIEFEVSWHNGGREISDNYLHRVGNMKNTYNRLSNVLAEDISSILAGNPVFDGINIGAAYGDWGQEVFTGYPESSGVYPDMPYSRENINVPVTVYLSGNDLPAYTDFAAAVDMAQRAREAMERNGITAEYISLALNVISESGNYYCQKGGKIHRSELYSQNLAQRLYTAHLPDCKRCAEKAS